MWKRDEPAEKAQPRPQQETPSEPAPPSEPAKPRTEQAVIGPSITIQGDVTGEEDLLIQGRVDGSVDLGKHSVTVGAEGKVKASISGRMVTVEGSVEGNLEGQEQVVLRSSAHVQGDIKAPRVVLEDGAGFRGGVDMVESKPEGSGTGGGSRPERKESPKSENAGTEADGSADGGSAGSKKKSAAAG